MRLSVLLLLPFLSLSLVAGAPEVSDATNYKSGLEKIKAIMLDPQEGIPTDYQENPDGPGVNTQRVGVAMAKKAGLFE